MSPPRRGRRLVFLVLMLGLAAAGVALGLLAGWASPPRRWQLASGWDRIPSTERVPIEARLWSGAGAPSVRWLGHAGMVVDWRGQRLVIDPHTRAWCTSARRAMALPVSLRELGPIDAVLITHAHYDHLDLPTLREGELAMVVVPAGSEGYVQPLAAEGVPVRGARLGEPIFLGPLEVIAVPAVHNGNRFHPLPSRKHAFGYVIRPRDALGDAIYDAGDTGFGDHFAAIRAQWHPRAALLPIGAFSPRVPIGWYHLSPEQAVEAAGILGVEVVIPMHYGTFPLSLDRPDQALPRFASAAHRQGLHWQMPPFLPRAASVAP